jgi:hypothetical protein
LYTFFSRWPLKTNLLDPISADGSMLSSSFLCFHSVSSLNPSYSSSGPALGTITCSNLNFDPKWVRSSRDEFLRCLANSYESETPSGMKVYRGLWVRGVKPRRRCWVKKRRGMGFVSIDYI